LAGIGHIRHIRKQSGLLADAGTTATAGIITGVTGGDFPGVINIKVRIF
jgi:hypothetical protein